MRIGTKLKLRQDGWDEDTRIPAGTIGTVVDTYSKGGCYIEFIIDGCVYSWNDIQPHEVDSLFDVVADEGETK